MDYQEFGSKYYKSQLYDLYKEIQNEIKDKVITKLLIKVQNMYKELTELKDENTSLKNHLSYILKRIILHKNEYNFINNNDQNNLLTNSIYKKKSTMNNSSVFKSSLYKRSQNSFRPMRSVENYRHATEDDLFYSPPKRKQNYQSKNKNINDEEYIYDKYNSSAIEHKIKGYLNTLYRNNFVTGNKGITNNFNLDKKKTIYEELFPSTTKRNFKTINYNESYRGKKIKNLKKRANLSQRGNSILKNNRDTSNKKSLDRHPIRIKDYREEQIKGVYFDTSTFNFDDTDFDYKLDLEDNYNYASKYSTGTKIKKKNHRNPKNNYGEKIKAKKGLLYLKRSPFL